MIKKKIASSNISIVSSGLGSDNFPVGTVFIMNNLEWKVVQSFRQDNTEMRKITTKDGVEEEILTLRTLMRENFSVKLRKILVCVLIILENFLKSH